MADGSPLAHSPTLAVTEPRSSRSSDDRVEAGTQIGDYVVERFLGGGAMGEVYAGRHPVIGKRVAIKILRHELAASAEAAERFIREARAVNQIEHENVVDVFAFGRLDDGRLYLVMDLVEGRSLRAHLVDGPLDLAQALAILETIADALDAAHARGVVHRDLKPDNIVLSSATPPKVFVLDFGIAKLISTANGDASKPGTLTGAGTWLGTPGYMAPEQWSVDGAGPASDRYALGVIAFELLSGAPPFSASSVPGMMEQHFRADVPTLSSRGAVGVPTAIDAVLRKALAKNPDARYATARDFVAALRDAAGTGAMRARGAVVVPAGQGGIPRKLWVPAAAAIGVLVVGAGAVMVASGRKDTDDAKPIAAPPARTSSPPAGTVAVDVVSVPEGAEVRSNHGGIDVTPTRLFTPADAPLELVVRKPGYLPERKRVNTPGETSVRVELVAVNEFRGVWQLANGELRAFERRDDHVDVFKAASVSGERQFFRQYAFQLVDQGVGFGGEEVVADPVAPSEPTCNIRMRADYIYDPRTDTLEQRREQVDIELVNGKCVELARKTVSTRLVRADRGTGERRELAMPVGDPRLIKGKKPPVKQTRPTKTGKTAALPVETKKPTQTYTKEPPAQQANQIAPEPNAPVPQVTQEPQDLQIQAPKSKK